MMASHNQVSDDWYLGASSFDERCIRQSLEYSNRLVNIKLSEAYSCGDYTSAAWPLYRSSKPSIKVTLGDKGPKLG
jgi:hypothetical protein